MWMMRKRQKGRDCLVNYLERGVDGATFRNFVYLERKVKD